MRSLKIEPGFIEQADGSALISFGKTRVICTASVEDGVPPWLSGKGSGWLTAEYGMLPASTGRRGKREASSGSQRGRTVEIQRLIGRSLRSAYDLEKMGERTIYLDCDVIQADGGTRTASISGAWVALAQAAIRKGLPHPNIGVAAISVGLVDGNILLDLEYTEDVRAQVDMNVVMTEDGRLIEVQSTAEGDPFERSQFEGLLDLATKGIGDVLIEQNRAVAFMNSVHE